MQIKEFITKLQNLPESQKKIVVWTIVIVLGLVMGFFWITGAMNSLQKLGESASQIELPEIQTPADQTADWKTYTNNEYGFEIKYPNNWHYEEIEQGIVEGGIYLSPYSPDESETGGMAFTNEALSINVSPATAQGSLLEYIENYLNLSSVTKYETEKIKIGGLDGLKVAAACEGVGCGNPHWFVQEGDKIYIFSSNLSAKIDIFEKILSTFKFTK